MKTTKGFVLSLVTASAILAGCQSQSPFQRLAEAKTNLKNAMYTALQDSAGATQRSIDRSGEEETLQMINSTMTRNFKDPESARFKDLRFVDYSVGKLLCGSVNGKNSYGAYVGYKPFIAGVNFAKIVSDLSKAEDQVTFDIIRELCSYS